MDVGAFNAEWLQAWSDKDVERLLGFYHKDTVYKDGQTVAGLRGHAELRSYLSSLFENTPPMRYEPDQVWAIAGGYCGRWNCTIDLPDGSRRRLRGFDLVLLDGEQISYNEVYTHDLGAAPD
ncbi:MAG: nuclear transport factor 2 family protein [Dehalococcoidia bacterium]|nr:nuclear transport factor 2 family protein [Dehalococcoidia bacterium]